METQPGRSGGKNIKHSDLPRPWSWASKTPKHYDVVIVVLDDIAEVFSAQIVKK